MVSQTGFNPALMGYSNMGGLNDDFMYNAYICQPDATRVAQNPAFTGLYNQPTGDTFEKQGKGSGWGTATAVGVGAGALGTAGMYYLGGDSVNPFKDGIPDSFLKTIEEEGLLGKKLQKE